jgi:hypothetical protein
MTLQSGLEFDNLKQRLINCTFKCISWLKGSALEGDDEGFVKVSVKTDQMPPMSPLKSPIFFFRLDILSSWLSTAAPRRTLTRTAVSALDVNGNVCGCARGSCPSPRQTVNPY